MVMLGTDDSIDGCEPAQVASMQSARDRYGYELLPPERTVCVGDASGAYQDAKHNPGDPPSWAHLREAGYRGVYPDPDEQRNPDVVARFARANHLLRHAPHQGIERRVFFLAEAVRAIEAARKLPHAQRRHPEAPEQARPRLGLLGLRCLAPVGPRRRGADRARQPVPGRAVTRQVATACAGLVSCPDPHLW
jgi:hypothetical protein